MDTQSIHDPQEVILHHVPKKVKNLYRKLTTGPIPLISMASSILPVRHPSHKKGREHVKARSGAILAPKRAYYILS